MSVRSVDGTVDSGFKLVVAADGAWSKDRRLITSDTPGVTLIGDAAHLTLSNGEGVNLAMHDSVELANAIQGHGLDSLDAAVIEHEQAMFPRAAEHIADGPNQWRMLTAFDALKDVLKLFAPRENMARL